MSRSNTGNLLSNSKKISKGCSSPSNLSKYKTFDDQLKRKVIIDLKKEIIQYFKLLLTEDSMPSEILVKKIDQFPLPLYNKTLIRILENHDVHVENETKSLTAWRKKMKAWIKADGKPETRGGLVIPFEVQPSFRERVHEILDQLPFRSLPLLREKILSALKDLLQTDNIDPNTCSKHWWFNYMRKNLDIKEKWENIDLERTKEKQKRLNAKFQDTESTDADSLSENNSSIPNQALDEPLYQEEIETTFSNSNQQIYEEKEIEEERSNWPFFENEMYFISSPSYFLSSYSPVENNNQFDENLNFDF